MTFFRKKSTGAETVAILGMHRSGTSCLAGSLQELGLYLGEVYDQNPHNLRGNRENAAIMNVNEAVLNASGGSWDNPPATPKWRRSHKQARTKIIRSFAAAGAGIWGFKDPRSLLTLPFWQEALPQMALVGTYRHPLLVARSLQARNQMSVEHGLQLWQTYNQRLLAIAEQNACRLISFDAPQDEYLRAVNRIAGELGIAVTDRNAPVSFADESLKNQQFTGSSEELPQQYLQLYEALDRIYRQQTDRSTG